MSFAMDRDLDAARPLSIVVLLGGWSAERAVSLASGRAVAAALRTFQHDVRELDPADMDICTYPWGGVDVAFIALHGTFGEDGTVQSLLDDLRVPYTGSDAVSSRLAMNKLQSKQRFLAANLPTPASRSVHVDDASSATDLASAIGYPLVVKPNGQGSSIGVTIVQKPEDLSDAVAIAFEYDPVAVLETFIRGRELTVAVLGRQALPLIEIRPGRSFFDYEAKYRDDATQYVLDTDLPRAVVQSAEAVAVAAVDALGCRGIARVDLRLDENHKPWLLEVNTIPGFTDHSLVPKAAARAGMSFGQLCDRLAREPLAAPIETSRNRAA